MVLGALRRLPLVAMLAVTSCPGLHTNPNDVGEVPQGALLVGDNVVVGRDGIIEPRRGFENVETFQDYQDDPATVYRLGVYGTHHLAVTALGDVWSSADGLTWTAVTGAPTGTVRRFVEASGNLYATTSLGVTRTESLSANATHPAGMPAGTDLAARPTTDTGSALASGYSAAFRAVWTYKDATGNKLVGAPTSRAITTGPAGGTTHDVLISTSVPAGLPSGAVVEFYRTAGLASGDPGEEMALVGERTVPPSNTISKLEGLDAYVDVTTSAAHGLQVGDIISSGHGTASGGGSSVPLGTWTVSAIVSSTKLSVFANAITSEFTVSIPMAVLAVGIRDNTPDSLRGQALYTNPTQETAVAAHYSPPSCQDAATFRGCMFFADTTDVQRLEIQLLSVGSPSGVVATDTLTITPSGGSAAAFTAHATDEIPDDQTNRFTAITSGTAAANVRGIALSLVRAINRYGTGAHSIQAAYISGPNDPPGMIALWQSTAAGVAFTVTASRSSSWLALGASTAEARPNGLSWSQQDQPDAVPLVNYTFVGSKTAHLRRVVPLRDSLILLKDDGVFRLTGDAPAAFRVDPLDLTVTLVGPEAAVALDNRVYALTSQGVMQVGDTGATIISRPIDNLIQPLLAPAMLATTKAVAFGVAYQSWHKYVLWLPTASTDTFATQALVYDFITQAWSRWDVSAACGMVSPVDDRMYLGAGSSVLQERKALTTADYADSSETFTVAAGSGPGTMTVPATAVVGDRVEQYGLHSAIITDIDQDTLIATLAPQASWALDTATLFHAFTATATWSPQLGGDPSALMHAREVDFLFRSIYFAAATAHFATDLYPTGDDVPLDGAAIGLVDPPTGSRQVRVWIPRNEQRGTRLSISWSQRQAQSAMQIQGFKLLYEGGSERSSK